MYVATDSQLNVECKSTAVPWIRDWFGDCVISSKDMFGFSLGFISIALWLVAQLPQFIRNIRYQSAEALSPWFLVQWLTGDTLNLLGCILTGDQLPTETFTACYFIFADCCIISQYIYYQMRNREGSVAMPIVREVGVRSLDTKTSVGLRHGHATGRSGAVIITHAWESINAPLTSNQSHQLPLPDRQQSCNVSALPSNATRPNLGGRQPGSGVPVSRRMARLIGRYGLEYGPLVQRHVGIRHNWQSGTQFQTNASLLPLNAASMATEEENIQTGRRSRQSTHRHVLACLAGVLLLYSSAWPWMMVSTGSIPLVDKTMAGISVDSRPRVGRLILQDWVEPDPYKGQVTSDDGLSEMKMAWWLGSQQPDGIRLTGLALGWGSACFYLGSRVSQLVLNHQRRSAEGLSMAMFLCAFLANLTYGAAILVRTNSLVGLGGKAPWIVGSMGTLMLDISIFIQAQYLCSQALRERTADQRPLLSEIV